MQLGQPQPAFANRE